MWQTFVGAHGDAPSPALRRQFHRRDRQPQRLMQNPQQRYRHERS
jgi:hypothetical protein